MKLYDGEALKMARKKMSMTQEDVSEVLGLGRRQISQMENGVFDGGLKYFLRYLSLLNLELSIVPGLSGWKNSESDIHLEDEGNELLNAFWGEGRDIKAEPLTQNYDELNKEIDAMFGDEHDNDEK